MIGPPGPGVPTGRTSPHVLVGRVTCPLLWAAALGAAQPCGVSLTTGGIHPAGLRYDRLTLVALVAKHICLAGDHLLECVPARLSLVASMAPVDICHGPLCSLAGLRPAALGYRPCCWPGESAWLPQCARPMGGGLLFPVPRPPYVCACVWCRRPLGACSPVCVHAVFCVFPVRCPGSLGSCSPVFPLIAVHSVCSVLGLLAPVHRCDRSVRCVVCAVSSATQLLFTCVSARCVGLHVWCPAGLRSCLPLRSLSALCCVCGVLLHLAPVHGCSCPRCCVACALS